MVCIFFKCNSQAKHSSVVVWASTSICFSAQQSEAHCFHPQWMNDSLGRSLCTSQLTCLQWLGRQWRRGRGAAGGGFQGDPGNVDQLMLGLPADQCCCGTTQLTADNEQHTLLIGHVSSTTPKKKKAPAIIGPVAHELGSQQGEPGGTRGTWGQESADQSELSGERTQDYKT